jgi:hypothetical protein
MFQSGDGIYSSSNIIWTISINNKTNINYEFNRKKSKI